MKPTIKILKGDSAQVLALFEANSIDLCVTSPPYDGIRSYNGHSKFNFEATALQLRRVLKPGGVVCWNVQSQCVDGSETLTPLKQAIFFVEVTGMFLHDTMIYERTNFSNPESVRYHQMWEYVFVFSNGKPKTFNPIKDKPNKYVGQGTYGRNTFRNKDGKMEERANSLNTAFGMRGNVWRGKTRGQEDMWKKMDHPAMMPRWLARDLIKSFSNEGDTVIDPFAGSGTTGWEAREQLRNSFLIDVDPHSVKMMKAYEKKLQPILV